MTEVATSKRRVKDDAKLGSYKGKVMKLRTSGKFGHTFANSKNPDETMSRLIRIVTVCLDNYILLFQ